MSEFEKAARLIGGVLTDQAAGNGWQLRNLTLAFDELAIVPVWGVEIVGPRWIDEDVVRCADDDAGPRFTWGIVSDRVGTLHARTPEDLAEQVARCLTSLGAQGYPVLARVLKEKAAS